jgi:hypothetical protein
LALFCQTHRKDDRVEVADRALAAREGAGLVAVEAPQLRQRAAIAGIGIERGGERQLRQAHAAPIDHRLGDAAGEFVTCRIRLGAGHRGRDGARELDHLARERGVAKYWQVEAVLQRVAGDDRLAGARPWAGALTRVAPVGADLCRAGHGTSSAACELPVLRRRGPCRKAEEKSAPVIPVGPDWALRNPGRQHPHFACAPCRLRR